jgi:hypothetical protein
MRQESLCESCYSTHAVLTARSLRDLEDGDEQEAEQESRRIPAA